MIRIKEWRTLRALNKEADKIIEEYSQIIEKAETSEERERLKCGKQADLDEVVPYILYLQTQILFRQANKWDIIIPDDEEWFQQKREYRVLSVDGAAKLRTLIRETRQKNIEWRVKIIATILAAITGVIGTIIGLIAILKK